MVIEGAFHGRTMGALSATGSAAIQEAFKPLLPGFIRIGRNDIEGLEQVAKQHSDVVAVHLEPIQGESGIWPMEIEFLQRARDFAINTTGCLALMKCNRAMVVVALCTFSNVWGYQMCWRQRKAWVMASLSAPV